MRITPPKTLVPSALLGGLLLAGGLALSGCGESWNRSRDTAILAVERGDNQTALDESLRIVRSGPRSMRPEAAYLGGMASFRLGDQSEALRLLDIAVTGSDQTLRGQALIQRGTVEREIGRTREAGADLERGGLLLGGDTGRSALLRAAEAYKQLGLEADARRCIDAADRLGGGRSGAPSFIAGFTIQFGAYQDRGNAENLARRLAPEIRAARLPAVEITRQDGLYKVQSGCYADIMSAQRDLDRLRTTAGVHPIVTEIGG
jgi:tetratricopeptide (TPR) repeat protein